MVAVIALIGCGSTAPDRSSTAAEAADVPPRSAPGPVAAVEPAAGAERAEPTPLQLLVRGEPMFWLVPQPEGGAGVCRPFEATQATQGPEGWIEPVRAVREDADGNSYVQHEDGHSETIPDPGPAPFRRVRFEYRYSEMRVELASPRGLVGLNNGLLANCTQTFEVSELPWFATEAACDAAASSREPLDLGACAESVLGFPAHDHARDRLGPVLARGGQLYELGHGPDGPRCRRWRFVPPADSRDAGQMIHLERAENARTRVSYQYTYGGRILGMAGPYSQTWVDGRRTSSGGLLCAENYYVHHPSAEYASVGGVRWYYRAADCERAMEDPDVYAGRGGC